MPGLWSLGAWGFKDERTLLSLELVRLNMISFLFGLMSEEATLKHPLYTCHLTPLQFALKMSDSEEEQQDRNPRVDDALEHLVDDPLFNLASQTIKGWKGVFKREGDVEKYLLEFGDVAQQPKDGSSNLLHAIVEHLANFEIRELDDVLPLVKRLVQDYPQLLQTSNDQNQTPVFFALTRKNSTLVNYVIEYSSAQSEAQRCLKEALEMSCSTAKDKTCLREQFRCPSG